MKTEENKLQNIILTGMPGSGKTTAGKALSLLTGFQFTDLDNLIEENEGIKITEIFKTKGENYFRQKETEIIKKLLNKKEIIIATGGGTVLNPENVRLLKQTGIIFYLEANPEIIYERIKDEKKRPLLLGENPKNRLFELYKIRKESYENSFDMKINANGTVEDTVNKIKASLK